MSWCPCICTPSLSVEVNFLPGLFERLSDVLCKWKTLHRTYDACPFRHSTQEVTTPPYPLLWLRYSAFIPLYPLGVASELTMASLALPVIRVKRPLTLDMPNALNWGFDYYYFCWLAIACYLPGGSL